MTAPWVLPNVWENNVFFFYLPKLKGIFLNPYFRGAVTGVGLLNVVLAISEVLAREKSKHVFGSRSKI
jgi:hypothetical protein